MARCPECGKRIDARELGATEDELASWWVLEVLDIDCTLAFRFRGAPLPRWYLTTISACVEPLGSRALLRAACLPFWLYWRATLGASAPWRTAENHVKWY